MKKTLLYLLSVLILWLIEGCNPTSENLIITVTGPIPASEMGLTLIHEHLLVDFIGADSTGYHRWDKTEVEEKVMPFLTEIRNLGVNTLIECTPAYLGRDPLLLKSLSEKTGLNLITNTGFYGAHNNKFIPDSLLELTAVEISEIWIAEFENGIEGTGIRPGFIKIGVDRNDTLSAEHKKIIHAAALANIQTGLVIASHTGPDMPAHEQIEILKSHQIDPSSFIWVHAQRGSIEGNIKAAREGAWISLDNINLEKDTEPGIKFNTEWYADRILFLKNEGLLNRVLTSHDAGWYRPEQENGGEFRGFTGIFSSLIPELKERGFTQNDIDQLFILNPRKAFAIKEQL